MKIHAMRILGVMRGALDDSSKGSESSWKRKTTNVRASRSGRTRKTHVRAMPRGQGVGTCKCIISSGETVLF